MTRHAGAMGQMTAAAVAVLVTAVCGGCARPAVQPGPPKPTAPATRSGPVPSASSVTHPAGPGPAWIITAGSLPRLASAGLPVAILDADFDNPGTLVLGQGRVDDLVPRASPAMVFTSETSLAAALDAGQVGAAVRWVLLDLEDWPLTPASEQADPIGALRAAIAAAHAHGKKVLFTPAVDLLTVMAPGTAASARFATFDRLVAGPGARLADGFEVQSQQTEGTASATTFAAQAAGAARAAHPGAPVLAGLSTNPDGRRVTATDLMTLYQAAAAAGVSGFWLNIPEASPECPRCGAPQTAVAVAFLRTLSG
jgi:hypothetical protein